MVSGRDGKNLGGTGIKFCSSWAYLRLKLRFDNRVILEEKAPHKKTIFGLIFYVGHPRGGFAYPQKAEANPYMKIKSKRGWGQNLAQKFKTAQMRM